MMVRNIEIFSNEDLYRCTNIGIVEFLSNYRNIVHIKKEVDKEGNECWVYFDTNELKFALAEYEILEGGGNDE